jgi:hypothetical protein
MSNFDFDIDIPERAYEKDFSDVENFPLKASKFFPLSNGEVIVLLRSRILGRCNAKNKGAKFLSRTVTENGIEGVRIWRTA